MNKLKIIFLNSVIFLLTISYASAQHITCDGKRYKHNTFTQIDSVIDVKYGQNYTMNHVLQDLKMDIYQPKGDLAPKRPLILFFHFGGFIEFDKTVFAPLCIAMAERGFVSATVGYRLADSLKMKDSLVAAEALVMAVSDARAAIRFFVEDAAATTSTYKIDTNYIFVSGASAGGMIASHVAYLDSTDNIPPYLLNLIKSNGGFKGNSSTNLSHTAPVKALLNYSGALLHKEFISKGEPALYLVHDLYDSVMPCGIKTTYPLGFAWRMEGSCAMQAQANLKGIDNNSFYVNSEDHCSYLADPQLLDSVLQKSAEFLYDILCPNITAISQNDNAEPDIQVIPNPATTSIKLVFDESIHAPRHIKIYNIQGSLVEETEVENKKAVSIGHLKEGMYFLRVNDKTIKFIKN